MALPKNFWKPTKRMGPLGAYAWYAGRGLIFVSGIVTMVFIARFGHDLYSKVTGKTVSSKTETII